MLFAIHKKQTVLWKCTRVSTTGRNHNRSLRIRQQIADHWYKQTGIVVAYTLQPSHVNNSEFSLTGNDGLSITWSPMKLLCPYPLSSLTSLPWNIVCGFSFLRRGAGRWKVKGDLPFRPEFIYLCASLYYAYLYMLYNTRRTLYNVQLYTFYVQ